MDGLDFITATPPVAIDPARADIACFVGFIARRSIDVGAERLSIELALREVEWLGPPLPEGRQLLPPEIVAGGAGRDSFAEWLRALGWRAKKPEEKPRRIPARPHELFGIVVRRLRPGIIVDWWIANDYLQPTTGRSANDVLEILDLPVPIDTWETFHALFAWNARAIDDTGNAPLCDTMLGAAVRTFFAQGGRFCYVVRLGDPWPVRATVGHRSAHAGAFLPTFPPVSPMDRRSWRGVGHLFGLPGVSYLCLPDVPDLFSVSPQLRDPFTPPEGPEVFVECATRTGLGEQRFLRGVPPPRCDHKGFGLWSSFLVRLGKFVADPAHRLREIQIVAAVPLPIDLRAVAAEGDAQAQVHRAARVQWEEVAKIETAFVQLVYPWLRTRESGLLPGNLIAPDGLFAGLLAQNAVAHGAWNNLTHERVPAISAVDPVLDRATLELALPESEVVLRDHVSVIGPGARGMIVLSDVTTDDDFVYRPASVNRLVVALLRAARVLGDTVVFENNGEVLWTRVREGLEILLAGLWAEGALLGGSAREAFEVRCDRSTMTQADIDAGRLVARVIFTAAQPIVRVTVVLAMDDAGQVTLASPVSTLNPQAA